MVEAICIGVYGLVTLFFSYLCGRAGESMDESMVRILLWPILLPLLAANLLGLKHRRIR